MPWLKALRVVLLKIIPIKHVGALSVKLSLLENKSLEDYQPISLLVVKYGLSKYWLLSLFETDF